MSKQYSVSLMVAIRPDKQEELQRELDKIRDFLTENRHHHFSRLDTIHYARWIIVKGDTVQGEVIPPQLALFANVDQDEEHFLRYLADECADIIHPVYSCCEGYPVSDINNVTAGDKDKVYQYLKSLSIKENAFYIGARGKTVIDIKNEDELHCFIREYLDNNDYKGKSAKDVHRDIRQAVLDSGRYDWVKNTKAMPGIRWVPFIFFCLIILILLPVIIVWVLAIQFFYERKDKPLGLKRSQVPDAHMKNLESYEDIEFQNQFSQLMTMKPGRMRLITYKALMIFTRSLVKILFVKGKLMGIPTIHFARWVLIDNDKRMLFASNFDGSWIQYLGDFIDKSGWGLSAIFSNTTFFPKTKFLFFKGAYDEERFLAWSRYYEVPTQVWYNAYPHLSIKNVNNNGHIRYELMQNLSEARARNFLKRF